MEMRLTLLSRHRVRSEVLGAVAVLAMLTLPISTSSASTTTCKSATGAKLSGKSLCVGMAYYAGKTITFIAPTAAGSTFDIASRDISKEMSSYFGATVNVEDINPGQTITGQDEIMASAPNGLTIGYLNPAADLYNVVTNTPGVNFNVKDAAILGGEPPTATACLASQTNSPYSSFAKLVAAGKSTPLKVLYTSGAGATETILLLKAFGIKYQLISFANSSAVTQGFLNGEANLASSGVPQLGSELKAGIDRCLVMLTDSLTVPRTATDYSTIQSTPTMAGLLQKYKPKTKTEKDAAKYALAVTQIPAYSMAAPSATPSDLIAALDEATKYALTSTFCKTQIKSLGNAPGLESARAQKTAYLNALKIAPQIAAVIQ